METVGIICEYNPFHKGHFKQLQEVRRQGGEGIVCLMSGNYVQRGAPAIVDKTYRAATAMDCGADLVLELPVTAALSSAEGFAREGVRLLGGFCDRLCFGAETEDTSALMALAQAQLQEEYPLALRQALETGCSFPAARDLALASLGLDAAPLKLPNNILAVEYCKAILSLNCPMMPMVIHRQGSYHAQQADLENPSATAVRHGMLNAEPWQNLVPAPAAARIKNAPVHTLAAGERGILARLRTMSDADYEALPYGSEGLWRKLMQEGRRGCSIEEIASRVKSKRYTRSRIDRMILCAFLGLTARDLAQPAPYARVLALNHRGGEILKRARNTGWYPNIGEKTGDPLEALEHRCDDLYGLFAQGNPEPAGIAGKRRVYFSSEG